MSWDAAQEAVRQHKHKPTLKQIKALKYISQGMTKRSAMLKAGYSMSTAAHPKRELLSHKGVQNSLASLKTRLVDKGMTDEFMVNKFWEWMNAQKLTNSLTEPDREVPDYQTQLKAYDKWKDLQDDMGGGGKVKRKLTIEEFVTDKEEVIAGESE